MTWDGRSETRWRLDRRIPVALIAAILFAALIVWLK
jgi:hypothetical protein